jgi:hypothetical protein
VRNLFAFAVVTFFGAYPSIAATDFAEPSGIESLGRELLEDLGPEAIRPGNARLSDRANEPGPGAPAEHGSTPRFDDLGEDIGAPSGPLSLARVRQGMQQAESLLATKNGPTNVGTVTQARAVQQQVVEQLDKLIAELSKQCQGGQCQPSDQPPKPSERSSAKPGKPKSPLGRGQTAARESSDRLNQSSAQAAEKGDIDAILKDLWGHLPERSREQMMQSFSEEFLPKYQLEIEQYYRRLSEDSDANVRQ